MRTILAAAALAAAIVVAIALVVPVIARPMVVDAVRAALPFGDGPLEVDVDLNVFGLIQGTVDRIHVHGTDLASGDVRIGALDATATDVATTGRAFGTLTGTLATVAVPTIGGDPITIRDVQLDGTSQALTAIARLDSVATTRLIESAFADGGFDVRHIELGSGTVSFEILGQQAQVPVGVEDGALVLVNPFGTGSFDLVAPTSDDPWQLTGVSVTPDGLTIDATVDAVRLLPST